MSHELDWEIYEGLGFDLDAAIAEYKTAKEAHRSTVGVAAPSAHPLVEFLVNVFDGAYTVSAKPPEPDPVEPSPQPLRVSAVSALLVLDRVGLYNTVHNALSNHPVSAVRVWYARTINWEENHPYIQAFGPEFGLTDEQIHDLFVQAKALDEQLEAA